MTVDQLMFQRPANVKQQQCEHRPGAEKVRRLDVPAEFALRLSAVGGCADTVDRRDQREVKVGA